MPGPASPSTAPSDRYWAACKQYTTRHGKRQWSSPRRISPGREKTSFAPLTNRGKRGYNGQAFDFEELICECAGIGRQASLRCLCSTGRVGSSPITRTIPQNESNRRARVVELADSLDSGSSAHYGRAGSSPASRTKRTSERVSVFAYTCVFLRIHPCNFSPFLL